jgi:bifunctional non-homologous end joining protein LigD
MVQWSSRSPARDRRSPEGFIEPCKPALTAVAPAGPDWIHELKHDGWRIIARNDSGSLRLWSRN